MTAEIIRLPYSVTRGAHSRKPRRSKNGTPEERAARASPAAPILEMPGSAARTVKRADEVTELLAAFTPAERSAALRLLEVMRKG